MIRFRILGTIRHRNPLHWPQQYAIRNMASFSNTDTGNKSSGPYYDKNVDNEVPLKEKIEAVSKFVSSCKFGMMTTRDPSNQKLVSRCMAIAGKVSGGTFLDLERENAKKSY